MYSKRLQAGLYSAVLSAFLVESYSSLQPDTGTQTVYLLERIAAQTQSYTITSMTMNSTILFPDPPAFVAPEWAVRVNGLWFASLIVSLATASLSMLVKQWLREFIAMEWDTPQKRLRAHQYRQPALAKWRVFEIAAFLPMLLQTSFGLFFVGLCFFTASVDERMGRTSLPLVSGWAFFLVFTTLSPLFSPRCPYKVPLLKNAMRAVRRQLTMHMRRGLLDVIMYPIGQSKGKSDIEQDLEEIDVVAGADNDADILVSTDMIMANDSLLPTLWDAFRQSSQDPAQSFGFVLGLVVNRLGRAGKDLQAPRIRSIPDLSPLSRRAWDVFMEMFAELSRRQPEHHNITLLLLSHSPYPLPDSASASLRVVLAEQPTESIAAWIAPLPQDSAFVFRPLAPRLRPLLAVVNPLPRPPLAAVLRIYKEILRPYCKHAPSTSDSLYLMLSREPHLFQDSRATPILNDLWDIIDVNSLSESKNGGEIKIGTIEGLILTLEYAPQMGREAEAMKSLTTWWAARRWTYSILTHVYTALHQRIRPSRAHVLELITNAFLKSEGVSSRHQPRLSC